MFATYNHETYGWIPNRRTTELVTQDPRKADDSFVCHKGMFYKPITLAQVTDLYDVEFWVSYTSGFDQVSKWWKLGTPTPTVGDTEVTLVFAKGQLPGWRTIEKNVCQTDVDVASLEAGKRRIIYQKKDGQVCQTPVVYEQCLTASELVQQYHTHNKEYDI